MIEIMNMTEEQFQASQEATNRFLSKVFLIGTYASYKTAECPDEVEE